MKTSFCEIWGLVLVLSVAYHRVECEPEENKVKLSDVQVLTLYRDQFTNGRRLPGVPQLKCINGYYLCEQYAPRSVQCYNKGTDGSEVQWECKAELDKRVRFGFLNVKCEGFESARDRYVLAGSCGLEYSLELTSRSAKNYNDNFHRDLYEANRLSNFLTFLIIIVIMLIVYKSCTKHHENTASHSRPGFGVGGGGIYAEVGEPAESANLHFPAASAAASSSFPPPPPPYAYAADPSNAQQQQRPPGFKPEYTPSTNQERVPSAPSSATASTSNGWGSFLTGVGVGGVTGFLVSRRNASPTREPDLGRRSGADSPPPAYHDHAHIATGFASTTRR